MPATDTSLVGDSMPKRSRLHAGTEPANRTLVVKDADRPHAVRGDYAEFEYPRRTIKVLRQSAESRA